MLSSIRRLRIVHTYGKLLIVLMAALGCVGSLSTGVKHREGEATSCSRVQLKMQYQQRKGIRRGRRREIEIYTQRFSSLPAVDRAAFRKFMA